jgi:hypothetical protein
VSERYLHLYLLVILQVSSDDLRRTLADLNSTLDELSGQSRLKKLLWRDDIGAKVSDTYRDLSEAALLFDVSNP